MGGDGGETRSRGRGKHNQIYHIKKSIFNKTIYIYNKDIFILRQHFQRFKKNESSEIFPLVLCCAIYG